MNSKVEWHHPLFYGSQNKQIAEIFVPAFKDCHDDRKKKLIFEWVAINQHYEYLIRKYPKRDWAQRKFFLNSIYGKYEGSMGIEL
jgi:hypothetical protein